MNKVDTVLKIALGELGVHESPPRSNSGWRVREYQSHTFLGGTGWPWCAAFVNWVFDKAGIGFPYKSASAYGMLDWARKVGWARTKPLPGDLGVVHNGAGHINLVRRVEGTTVYCIDGNHLDRVAETIRHTWEFAGFIRNPALYSTVHKPVPHATIPKFEVVTSESGTKKIVYVSGRKAVARFVRNRIGKWLSAGKTVTVKPHK